MSTSVTSQIQGIFQGVAIKAPVHAVATTNITLSGLQTVGGVVLDGSTLKRVLTTAQTNSVDNGIWDAGTGSWSRAKDFDGPRDVVKGTLIPKDSSTSGIFYQVTSSNPIIPGTSQITIVAKESLLTQQDLTDIGIFSTGVEYILTDAEDDAGVTPVNYYKEAGYTLRYGTNTTPGTTNMTAALNTLADVCRAGNYVAYLPEETCFVTGSLDFSGITVRGTGPNNSINRPHIQASSAQFDVITSTGGSTFEDFYVNGGWDGVTAGQSGNIFSLSNGAGFAYVITFKNVKAQLAKRSMIYWKNGGYGAIRGFKGNAAGLHGIELFGAAIDHQTTTIQIDGYSTFSDTPNGYGADLTECTMIGFSHVIMEGTKGIRLNGGNHRALSFYKVYQEFGVGANFITDNASDGIGLTIEGCYGSGGIVPYFTNWVNVSMFGNSNMNDSAIPYAGRIVVADSNEQTSSTTGGVNFTGCTLALPPGTWIIDAKMQTLDAAGSTIVKAGLLITNTVGDAGLNINTNSSFNESADECNAFGASQDGTLKSHKIVQNLTSGTVNTYVRGHINISAGTIAYRVFAAAVKLQ